MSTPDPVQNPPVQSAPRKGKRRIVLSVLALAFVLIAIVWVLLYIFIFSLRETTDDAYVWAPYDLVAYANSTLLRAESVANRREFFVLIVRPCFIAAWIGINDYNDHCPRSAFASESSHARHSSEMA